MGQKKLQRFAEIKSFENVLEYPVHMPGTWSSFFHNNNPVILELACGKGEYAVGLGGLHPDKNYIGVDLKGNRIWVGAKKALAAGMKNVAFIRSQIDKVDQYFEAGEVEEIWITFPDPQLRTSKAKKRLTHPHFLRLYDRILKPGGKIHLKTDSPDLYLFTKTVIELYELNLVEDIDNVYAASQVRDDLAIRTYYESLDIARSNKVHYLQFSLAGKLDEMKDLQLKELIVEQEAGR